MYSMTVILGLIEPGSAGLIKKRPLVQWVMSGKKGNVEKDFVCQPICFKRAALKTKS